MTAIAYRDGVMVSDTMAWTGDRSSVMVPCGPKIVRLSNGDLVSATGASSDCLAFKEWMENQPGDPQPVMEDDFCGIHVRKSDGSVWRCGKNLKFFRSFAAFEALGCPVTFMLGAMYAGASATNAVWLAVQYTDGAGGALQIEFI